VSRYFPLFVDLRGRRCVVVGGGEQAAAKLEPLLAAEAEVTVIAEHVVSPIVEAARARRLAWLARSFRAGDLDGARLVIDASGEETTARQVRDDADRAGALLNVVDRPGLCDWIAPAVVDRDPLTIAISTAGQSPFLAAAVRRRLEADIGAEWGPFTTLVGSLRRSLRRRRVSPAEQHRAYRRALSSPARRLLREGRTAEAKTLVERAAAGPVAGRVTIAGAGPGSASLLTVAVRDALATADVVFHDALVEPDVLAVCGPDARLVDVGKRAGQPHPSQREINRLLIAAARAGQEVMRLKGGDPFVFGRGAEELATVADAGIDVHVLPGVSSATGAPALAGIPLTMRGVAASVAICTAQRGDGPAELAQLARSADTLVVLMAFARTKQVTSELAGILGGDHPAALIARAGTRRQRVICSTLCGLPTAAAASAAEPPALLVVGEVVRAAQSRPPAPQVEENADANLQVGTDG
jgi:uroporphyrin-III C-methyltransferase/precorrin-2 dehydrogenase/sirohydrochlorin ferrochelatase